MGMGSIPLPKIPLLPFSKSLNPTYPSPSLITLQPKTSPLSFHRRLSSVPRSAALSGSSGGGEGESSWSIAAGETEEIPNLGNDEDAILLRVGGMACDGCAASVKCILENQQHVSIATVSFEKATAVVWVSPEVKVTDNWQQELGEKLANHLTTCGFKSGLQGNFLLVNYLESVHQVQFSRHLNILKQTLAISNQNLTGTHFFKSQERVQKRVCSSIVVERRDQHISPSFKRARRATKDLLAEDYEKFLKGRCRTLQYIDWPMSRVVRF